MGSYPSTGNTDFEGSSRITDSLVWGAGNSNQGAYEQQIFCLPPLPIRGGTHPAITIGQIPCDDRCQGSADATDRGIQLDTDTDVRQPAIHQRRKFAGTPGQCR